MVSISQVLVSLILAIVTVGNSQDATALMITKRGISISGALKRMGFRQSTGKTRQINSIKFHAKNIERHMETIHAITDMSAGQELQLVQAIRNATRKNWPSQAKIKNVLTQAYSQMIDRLKYMYESLLLLSVNLLSESDKKYFYSLRLVLAKNLFELCKLEKTRHSSFDNEHYPVINSNKEVSRYILPVLTEINYLIGEDFSSICPFINSLIEGDDISTDDWSAFLNSLRLV